MQLTLLQENLQQAVSYIQKAIPTRPQLPILSSILITVTEDTCTIGATDLYFGVRATVAAEIKKPGIVAVPGKEFREIIFSLPAGNVTLDYVDGTLKITTPATTFSVQCPESTEYPQFPQVTGEVITLEKELFKNIAVVTLFSASSDQARPLLTGILFELSPEKTRIVATDGFRLSVTDYTPKQEQAATRFILPAKAVGEVCRVVGQLESETIVFTVSEALKQVFISFSGIEMYARVLEGEYPPYERIMPSLFTTEVTVSSEEVLEQVKRATIFSRDTSSIVQLQITPEKLIVTASSSTLGNFSGEIATAHIKGDGGTIAFKSKYLLDFLQATKDNEIWFGMSDSLKPALFQAKKYPGYQYVVMPFRVST